MNTRYTGTGGIATWPRTLQFPVYIYRLSCAVGFQTNQTTGTNEKVYPVIQYRLTGTQVAEDDMWTYNWTPVNPNWNVNESQVTRNAPMVSREERDVRADRIYHEHTIVKLLLTAPTTKCVDAEIALIQFNDDIFAPPDNYMLEAPDNDIETLPSGGIKNIGDAAALAAYYDSWLFNKMSHPCVTAKRTPGLVGPKPFRYMKRHKMTLLPRDTASGDTSGLQYMHKEVVRAHRWHNTFYPHITQNQEGPDLQPTTEVFQKVVQMNDTCGVFPVPTKQLWLMVNCFQSSALGSASNFAPETEASFDIGITSTFRNANI